MFYLLFPLSSLMLYLLSISYMPYTKLETYKHPVGKHQHSQSVREDCFRRLQGSHKPHGCQWELSLVLGLPGSKVYTQPSSLSTIQFHPTAIVGCSFFLRQSLSIYPKLELTT